MNRGFFISSAIRVFAIIAAPFEISAFALILVGSTGYLWWSVAMPSVLSLVAAIVVIVAVPARGIDLLAKSVGLSCLLGVAVIVSAVCAYLVALTKLSGMPSSLSSQAEFIGVVCAFSVPFGLLCGVFFHGAAQHCMSVVVPAELQ